MIKWKTFHKTLWATNHIIQNIKVFYIKMCQRLNNKVIFSLKKIAFILFSCRMTTKKKVKCIGNENVKKNQFQSKKWSSQKKIKK